MILLLDNYDSFVHTLARYFRELEQPVRVVRNDAVEPGAMIAMGARALVISPGPRTPDDAGISVAAVRTLAGKLPMLGVCLGHQAIAQAFGGRVVRARRPVHGMTSPIRHDRRGLFAGLPNPLNATRYHSLVVTLPDKGQLHPIAFGPEDEIMAIKHCHYDIFGVQFHPESILTDGGHHLLRNFLSEAGIA